MYSSVHAANVYQKRLQNAWWELYVVIVGSNEAVGEAYDFEEKRDMKVYKGASVPGVECKSWLSRQTPSSETGVTLFRHKYSALNNIAIPYLPILAIKELYFSADCHWPEWSSWSMWLLWLVLAKTDGAQNQGMLSFLQWNPFTLQTACQGVAGAAEMNMWEQKRKAKPSSPPHAVTTS